MFDFTMKPRTRRAERAVAGNAITRAGFVEGEKTAPETARAAVDLIGQLFAREKQAKDVSVAERLAAISHNLAKKDRSLPG